MKLNTSKTKTMMVSRSHTIHPHSPTLTIGGTVLKESDGLVILEMTFDSKMTFEKHLRAVSRAASQWLGILRKSWQVFHDRLFLGRCLRGFVLPVLEYCSAIWCSAADTYLRLLHRVVSGASFLTGGVFECDLAHRRSVAVLCMLYKIRCNLMHPLYGALPVLYVPVRVTRVDQTSVHLCVSSLQNLAVSQDFIFPCQYLCETIFMTPCLMCGTSGFQEQGQCLFIGLTACLLLVSCCFPFSSSFYGLVLWGWGLWTDRVLIALSQQCIANIFFKNNNNNINQL